MVIFYFLVFIRFRILFLNIGLEGNIINEIIGDFNRKKKKKDY